VTVAMDWARMLVPLGLYVALAAIRSRALDLVAPAILIVFYLWRYWGQSLSA
jgi:hypothetical protein